MNLKRLIFFVAVTLIATQHLLLVGRGALTFWDESRYFVVANALQQLAAGNLSEFVRYLVDGTLGRPGALFVWALPIAIQQCIRTIWGLSAYDPIGLLPAQVLNLLVSLAIILGLYRFSSQRFSNQCVKIGVPLAFGLLSSSSIYIRHLVPYDAALLSFVIALCLIENSASARRGLIVWAGVLTGLGFSIYPGYYFLIPIVFSQVLGRCRGLNFELKANFLVKFFAGVALPILFWEALTSIGGHSYSAVLRGLSKTIKGGTYSEGFTFLPEYLLRVDGPLGLFLLVVLVMGAALSLFRLARSRTILPPSTTLTSGGFLILSTWLLWFWHSFSSAVISDMVFYGRIVHGFSIPLLLSVATYLDSLKIKRSLRALILLCTLASIVWWSFSSRQLLKIAYPRDLIYEYGLDGVGRSYRYSELDVCNHYTSSHLFAPETKEVVLLTEAGPPLPVLVNFCDFYPIRKVEPAFEVGPQQGRVFSAPHFSQFEGYLFEGLERADREYLRLKFPLVEIYMPLNE